MSYLDILQRSSLLRDERGSATTEWMVSVSIVVMMAVPVLGLVGDGTSQTSDDIVVSIEDTDSMGGSGFHGEEGAAEGAYLVTEDFMPGADMGVGFADGEGAGFVSFTADSVVDTPRFFASGNGMDRRDKPSNEPVFRRAATENDVVPDRSDTPRYSVPSAPVLVSQKLRVSEDHCVEDIVAEAPLQDEEIVPVKVVLASGR